MSIQKVAIVTGANTGIGKETARGLAEDGISIVIAVRDVAKGEAAKAEILEGLPEASITVMPLDLGSRESIRSFAKAFTEKYDRLDILVNNAGIWTKNRQTTVDGVEMIFGVNHLGTFLLTHELLPLLKKTAPSRIVVLASGIHYRGRMEWEDLQSSSRAWSSTAAYGQSKLANVLFTKALARRLAGSGVTVNAVHPGVVGTDLGRDLPKFVQAIGRLFLLTPRQGAATSLHVALSAEGATVSGAYFEKSAQRVASRAARDEDAQERLWSITEKLLELPVTPIVGNSSYDSGAAKKPKHLAFAAQTPS